MSTETQSPRIRWAAVAFGVVFALAAGSGHVVLLLPDGMDALRRWIGGVAMDTAPEALPFAAVIAVGVLIAAPAAVALVRLGRRGRRDEAPADTVEIAR